VSHAPETDTDRDAGLDVISALLQVFGGLIDPRSPEGSGTSWHRC
jgi:hypothetical protein